MGQHTFGELAAASANLSMIDQNIAGEMTNQHTMEEEGEEESSSYDEYSGKN